MALLMLTFIVSFVHRVLKLQHIKTVKMFAAKQIYDEVINSVVEGVKGDFAEELDDIQVLNELKHLWRSKLFGNKENKGETIAASSIPLSVETKDVNINLSYRFSNSLNGNNEYKHFVVKVPVGFKDDHEIMNKLSCEVIKKIVVLPQELAAQVLQQAIDTLIKEKDLPQLDGSCLLEDFASSDSSTSKLRFPHTQNQQFQIHRLQLDGNASDNTCDSSSSCTSSSSFNSFDADCVEEKDATIELNSDDDITDEDADETMDTENVILCQYEKVVRRGNKWRFSFKNGVMKVNGIDYVFARMYGSAEW